jgi:hypothetical protein
MQWMSGSALLIIIGMAFTASAGPSVTDANRKHKPGLL